MLFEKCNKMFGEYKYVIFRLVIGFLFFSHGAQKVFGWFGGQAVGSIFSWPIGYAGIIELIVGLAVLFGLWSRLFAAIGFIEMVIAYLMVHLTKGGSFHPLQTGGEVALLFAVSFLVIVWIGNGKLSLERTFSKKQTF